MKPLLQANNISLSVEGRDTPILYPLNLSIFSGEFVVILGHNGSGKSSLIKLLMGEKTPTTGTIHIDNKPLAKLSVQEKSQNIITLTQRPDDRLFMNLSLDENIKLWENRFPQNLQLDTQDVLEFTEKKDKLFRALHHPARVLSGGEKQSLLLALALAHPPRLLFLDEHTSSLDPAAAESIMAQTANAISEHKITTVMVTHRLEDAVKYGNRIIILYEGHVTYDKMKTANISEKELRERMEDVGASL